MQIGRRVKIGRSMRRAVSVQSHAFIPSDEAERIVVIYAALVWVKKSIESEGEHDEAICQSREHKITQNEWGNASGLIIQEAT